MEQTLADTAYEALTQMIYASEYKSGDKLVEQQIISKLGISRTPVREALRRLAADGLVDLCPGTFSRVHVFSDKEVLDIGLVRLAIDTIAAPLVVLNGSNRDFQDLAVLAADCQRAFERNDISERIRLDFEFHNTVVALSGNHELANIQNQLTKRGRLMQIQSYIERGNEFCDLSGHTEIINALNARDTAAAITAMQNHLKHPYTRTAASQQEWSSTVDALKTLRR